MSPNEKLFSALKQLGVEPNMDTFQERKRIQKLVYLIQEFEVDLNFHFNWYLYGPYSSALAHTIFDALENNSFSQQPQLLNHEKRSLEKLRVFLGDSINSTDNLELLASLSYLRKVNKEYRESKNQIISIIKEKKPQFTIEQIEAAWEKLESVAN